MPGVWLSADAVPDAGHSGDDPGFAEAFAQCRDRDAHGVDGETLTERQALEALLLPSADNMAWILARWDAGSQAAFERG